ncbi:hypothetical protein EVAR_38206_1 [Eumeta japonica]|uniref:Uncharacterized protein n=1 Tax=Eumeta variegata TaxID=151549 RepID=A0A4C1WDK0_EUMVA|nr:hypothetical protein EVAR_38206_1 [Eumeta japonica]
MVREKRRQNTLHAPTDVSRQDAPTLETSRDASDNQQSSTESVTRRRPVEPSLTYYLSRAGAALVGPSLSAFNLVPLFGLAGYVPCAILYAKPAQALGTRSTFVHRRHDRIPFAASIYIALVPLQWYPTSIVALTACRYENIKIICTLLEKSSPFILNQVGTGRIQLLHATYPRRTSLHLSYLRHFNFPRARLAQQIFTVNISAESNYGDRNAADDATRRHIGRQMGPDIRRSAANAGRATC